MFICDLLLNHLHDLTMEDWLASDGLPPSRLVIVYDN